ncbi:MAG: TIGR03663 family protein [Chloroflexi bacterium]|nr:TIGR03663 family protein [Chloroflexota bacterium]
MSELAEPLPLPRRAAAGETLLGRVLTLRLRLTWEAAGYASLLLVGLGLRLWDLGSRALHHDESLHGYYSYQLFLGNGYEHTPLLHGPFQIFGTALAFFVSGGASDYTLRVLPALFGTALVLLPLLFRSHLGRLGAFVAAALIAFSPTLLYFSRFARNDIYIAVFTLGLVVCLWRWVEERKDRYLYIGAGLLALSFATKENTFITVALLLLFLDLWVASDLARQSQRRMGEPPAAYGFYALAYIPFAWAIVALWPLIGGLRRTLGLRERTPAADFLVLLGTLAAPQFAAAVKAPLEAFGVDMDALAQEQRWGIPTVSLLLAGSAAVGLAWNWRVWALAAACFYVPYTLLFTSFFTNLDGFGTGIWDSLYYWMGQHGVRRGDQPDFYYLMLLPAYEFVALAFTGPALLYYSLRGGLRSWLLTALAVLALLAFFGADSFARTLGDARYLGEALVDVPFIGDTIAGMGTARAAAPLVAIAAVALFFAVRGTMFERFLVFWTAGSIVAYSWVGEKMPWLSVHVTLPVVVLAAYSLGKLLRVGTGDRGRETRRAPRRPWKAEAFRYAAPAVAAGCAALAAGLAVFAPHDGAAGVLRLAGIGLGATGIVATLVPLGRERFATVAAAVVLGALALFSVRVAVLASYDHGDVARELLIYTQTSPQVPDLVERIDRIAVDSGLGRDLPVQVDRTFTWPWGWYLRDYRRASYPTVGPGFQPEPGAVVIVAAPNQPYMKPFAEDYQPPSRFYLRRWFPEEYRGIGRKDNLAVAIWDFGGDLGRGATWRRWWRYWLDRAVTPQGVEAVAYFPLEYSESPLAPARREGAAADLEGRRTIGQPGSEAGQLRSPVGIALDAQGNVYVADSGNGRVQKFDAGGRFLGAVGGAGAEPGQFNQPADVAVDAQGNLYVADTWNHRIQKFGADLSFQVAWGRPTNDLINPGPDQMWGPRAIAVDAQGNVWVVDTGTHRVRQFAADGAPLGAFGGRGRQPGRFQEPVGIAIGADGSIFVADAGNARIQKFDAAFGFVAAYPIEQWADLDPRNKPYLAALPDGRLLASDGPHGRILLINQEGTVTDSLSAILGDPLSFPGSVAFDPASGFVYVADAAAGEVRRFPLTDFALR